MIRTSFTFALEDALRPQKLIGWLVALVAVVGVALLWIRFSSFSMSPLESYGQLAQIFCYRLVALAAAVVSMGVLAQEVEQKTVVYLLTRSIPRWQTLLGRALAAFVVVTLIGSVAVFASSLAVMGPRAIESPEVLRDYLVVLFGAAAYVSLFVFVSLLINRAMIVCLLFAFGWETFAQNLAGMKPLAVLTYMNAAAAHKEMRAQGMMTFFAGDMAPPLVSQPVAMMILSGIGASFLCLALWWFTHFEYSPREDAE
jgi:ABC-2 type transport system permease protein